MTVFQLKEKYTEVELRDLAAPVKNIEVRNSLKLRIKIELNLKVGF